MPFETVTLFSPSEGSNNTTDGDFLSNGHYEISSNVVLKKGHLATRYGSRVIPILNKDDTVKYENGQGFKWFNPSRGQSSKVFGDDNSVIMAAIGGDKYQIRLTGFGSKTKAIAENVTNDLGTDKQLHLVYWTTAENYAIAQDGFSNAYIWDSNSSARHSNGYDSENKTESEIPNGGTVGVYAHGQLHFAVNQKQIVIGDRIHRTNLSKPENILEFTEQVHQYTGTYLSPPSQLHGIMAAAPFPLNDTNHGHFGVMWHSPGGGIFSTNTNPPKDQWSQLELTKLALVDTAAEGPYALDTWPGDQVFRSRIGIQTIRSAVADLNDGDNSFFPISEPLRNLLDEDYQPWLRFASVSAWARGRKILCTIAPQVSGRFRWHRGLVSLNHTPLEGLRTKSAWEGVHTFPSEYSKIVQLIRGQFSSAEKQFMWAQGGCDNENFLVELDPGLKYDVLPDCSLRSIESQVLSTEIHGGQPLSQKCFKTGKIFFENICDDFEWEVYYRNHENTDFKLWSSGFSSSNINPDCDDEEFKDKQPKFIDAELGDLPPNKSYYLQVLVKWKGYAELKGLKLRYEFDTNDEGSFNPSSQSDCTNNAAQRCDFDLYEYSNEKVENSE